MDTTIKANYNENVLHSLSVTGTQSADSVTQRYVGENISFSAGVKAGYDLELFKITPNTVQNTSTVPGTITFVMPDADVKVEAVWKVKPLYTLTIQSTLVSPTGAGQYHAGDIVTINAGADTDRLDFKKWRANVPLDDLAAETRQQTIVMPATDLELMVDCTTKWMVTVDGTQANNWNGCFRVGDTVTIATGSGPIGTSFLKWNTNNPAYVKMGLPLTSNYFTFELQDYGDVTFTAEWDYHIM